MLIAAADGLLNVVNTSGEYLFGRYVVEQAKAMYGAGGRGRRRARAVHRRDLQPPVQHRQPGRLPAADVRRLASVQVPRRRAVAVHPSDRRAGRLPDDAARAVVAADGRAEGRRQQPRLLARQHHQAGAVAADQPRGEVQGQAGGGLLLRARRRRAPGRCRLRRRAPGTGGAGVCGNHPRTRRRMAHDRRTDQLVHRASDEEGDRPSVSARSASPLVPHHAQFEVPAAVAIGAPPDFGLHPEPDPLRDVPADLQT